MYSTLFLIGFWLTLTPIENMDVTFFDTIDVRPDTTSTILIELSRPIDTTGLNNFQNYKIYDSTNTIVNVYRVGIVSIIDDTPPSPPIIVDSVGTAIILLQTKRFNYRAAYRMEIFNVKDLDGNVIGNKNTASFYFNGFVPNRILSPTVEIKK